MADATPDNCKPASSYRSLSLHDPVKIRMRVGDTQPITIPQLFETVVKNHGDRPALVSQDATKNWITLNYQDYWTKSRQLARAFVKLGLKPRTSCGILAFSCSEWFLTQMATIFAGGVAAGIYMTNSAEVVCYILDSSNATICVVDDAVQMAKVRSIKDRLPKLKSVVQMHGPFGDFVNHEEGYYSWSQVEAIGEREVKLEHEVEQRLKNGAANECATLIYTSGTVGMPKAVMLSHDNAISMASAIIKSLPNMEYGHETIVSYLPLNHVGGQVLDLFMGMTLGACIYFADRNALKGTLIKTLIKAQPTIFFGVPRIFEKMQEKLIAVDRGMPWLSRYIVDTARSSVEYYHLAMMRGENKPINSWRYWLGSMVTRKFKTALGLDKCKMFMTGAAPSAIEMKKFFLSNDIKLSEMYGLSESAGPTNLAVPLETLESCGKTLPGIELRIANADEKGHGEICTRSRMVFMGYLNDAEKTNEAINEDGWYHTGDIGYLDSGKRLHISGRLKELIITSGGENIPPVHIELLVLRELPGLSNAMLIGDKRKYLTMLVTLKTHIDQDSGHPSDTLQPESLDWIKSLGLPYETLSEILNAGPCPKVLQSIQEGIDRANANAISNAQKVQKFTILPHDFSIPTGELGPTLKLRRNVVLEKYADVIENLYTGN